MKSKLRKKENLKLLGINQNMAFTNISVDKYCYTE